MMPWFGGLSTVKKSGEKASDRIFKRVVDWPSPVFDVPGMNPTFEGRANDWLNLNRKFEGRQGKGGEASRTRSWPQHGHRGLLGLRQYGTN